MASSTLEIPCNYCPKHTGPQSQSDELPVQCILTNGAPCQACARQLELTTQIEETKKLLDKLIAEEHQARMDINQFHDPFRRLPTEMISHIFGFSLPKFEFAPQEKDSEDDWQWLQRPPKTTSETGVLTLGAVCRLWRDIAWSIPQLWSDVMLTITEEPTSSMIEVIKEWIERSGEFPLSIRLFIGHDSFGRDSLDDQIVDDGDNVNMSHEAFAFIDLINRCSARWQNLSLQCDGDVSELFDARSSELNRLKTLQLIVHSDIHERRLPEFKFRPYSCATPQLEHIFTTGTSQLQNVEISWNNATNITIDCLLVADCLRLLQIAPKLINLRLEDVQHSNMVIVSDANVQQTPQTLPCLRSLYISATKFSLSVMLDPITLPSLEELRIDGMKDTDSAYNPPLRFPFQSVFGLLARSSCQLNSFALGYSACTEEEIIHILYFLPDSLKNLYLDIRIPNTIRTDHNLLVLFLHLSRGPFLEKGVPALSDLGLLPNLETFEYYVFEGTQIPWDFLLTIPRPLVGEKRPIKQLTINQRDAGPNVNIIAAQRQNIKNNIILALTALLGQGVDLYAPHKVSRRDLLAMLEEDSDEYFSMLFALSAQYRTLE